GLFVFDNRFVSEFLLTIDGRPVESLGVSSDDPTGAAFVGRPENVPEADRGEGKLLVFRRRFVGRGMREEIVIRSHDAVRRHHHVEIEVDADFADMFAVKERRVHRRDPSHLSLSPDGLHFSARRDGVELETSVTCSVPGAPSPGRMSWTIDLAPRSEWQVCVMVRIAVDGTPIEPRPHCGGAPEASVHPVPSILPDLVAEIDTDHPTLGRAVRRGGRDLRALTLTDPEHPSDPVVAAGAPWFMTLFGRDALLTALMGMVVDPSLAVGVLRTLARLQGQVQVAETEEEPGRILHEIRFHDRPSFSLADGTVYFGTADATPLFVLLVGELHRWGVAPEVVDELLPAADRALEWIVHFGDRDGDGYVEYERATSHGLANQGWKDSWDALRHPDGSFVDGPVALCEVQAYCYAAFQARAEIARHRGDVPTMERWRDQAASLATQFRRDFWIPGSDDGAHGFVAFALDGLKRPVATLASNMGHCLGWGLLDETQEAQVATHLASTTLFSGWGLRTMATTMAAYDPVSYHCGSVWPHDTAFTAWRLREAGCTDAALRLIDGLLGVADHFGGRLPELLAGVSRTELPTPAVYPTSCLPQAWAAASPLLALRTMLGLEPHVPSGVVAVAPVLPDGCDRLIVEGTPVGSIRAERVGDRVRVAVGELPEGCVVRAVPPDALA
ncbi:MAG: glycogen debranching N-terminal domain-containing protein, partial [Actinomycetes bacterium]